MKRHRLLYTSYGGYEPTSVLCIVYRKVCVCVQNDEGDVKWIAMCLSHPFFVVAYLDDLGIRKHALNAYICIF